jgi:putative flavoprotein involved in K+ transport
MPAPLVTGVRAGHDLDLRRDAYAGMTLLGRLRSVDRDSLAFSSDLEQCLAEGDRSFREFTAAVDRYVEREALDSPPASGDSESSRIPAAIADAERIDIRKSGITAVIWATGYAFDFGWIDLPVFAEDGMPAHRRGATALPGIHFLGLPWLHKPKSSFLYGVGEDAEHIAQSIHGKIC